MSYPNDAPAAAWYPDPQTSGQVRWWDGTNWTEHVSTPAAEAAVTQTTATETVATAAAPKTVATAAAPKTIAEQLAAPIVPQVAEADAAFAAADSDAVQAAGHIATVTYIGRHAAGATPVPRQPSTAPRIRSRVRIEAPAESPARVAVEALAYA
jgi:hypothetical protein